MNMWIVTEEPYHDNGNPVRWFSSREDAEAWMVVASPLVPPWYEHALYELLEGGDIRYVKGPFRGGEETQ